MNSIVVRQQNLFSTPFLHLKMNATFQEQMVQFFQIHTKVGNVKAKYNDSHLFDQFGEKEEMKLFKSEAYSILRLYVGVEAAALVTSERAWLCGSGPHYQIQSHNHANSVVSTIFYFKADFGRDLIFYDPRFNANRGYAEEYDKSFHFSEFRFNPQSGDIVVFPSYLYHAVPSHFGSGDRIAVALDFFSDT